VAAYNSFDVEAMLQFVHPDVVFKNAAGSEVNATATGIHEFRELAERSKSFFSARREQVTGLELFEKDRGVRKRIEVSELHIS
jgi:hypothetical protein